MNMEFPMLIPALILPQSIAQNRGPTWKLTHKAPPIRQDMTKTKNSYSCIFHDLQIMHHEMPAMQRKFQCVLL